MCAANVNSESHTTPRQTNCVQNSISTPWRVGVWYRICAFVTCCLLPNHMDCVLFVFSFSRFDIHLSSSSMHAVIRGICVTHDEAGVWMESCVSSAYESGVIQWRRAISITSAAYSRNNTGPRTLPCRTPQTTTDNVRGERWYVFYY